MKNLRFAVESYIGDPCPSVIFIHHFTTYSLWTYSLHQGFTFVMDYQKLQVSLGRTIRNFRTMRGYSQESFAHAVGLHRTYMGDIERGERNVSLRNLLRISDALEIPLSRLLAEAENSLDSEPKEE
jgi:DNA-binding XRE family transcriptional regulator